MLVDAEKALLPSDPLSFPEINHGILIANPDIKFQHNLTKQVKNYKLLVLHFVSIWHCKFLAFIAKFIPLILNYAKYT